MGKICALILVILFSATAPRVWADAAAIHANKLPQEKAVLAALADAKELGPYCRTWTGDWQFPVKKEMVVSRLTGDLGVLVQALRSHPDNEELALLTGLVARYAYNLDVPDTYAMAIWALDKAEKLAPRDMRAQWFRAAMECQTMKDRAGPEAFLSMESAHKWDQLPAAFWGDYITCATMTNMPQHALRAIGYLKRLNPKGAAQYKSAAQTAQSRIVPFDPAKNYAVKDAWQSSGGTDPTLTGWSCGARLRLRSFWTINQLALQKSTCVALFETGSYQGTTKQLHPGILLLIKPPEPGQTLENFAHKFMPPGPTRTFAPSRCPAQHCYGLAGVQEGMYGKDGDGHGRIVVFERDQPAFPGLIFESPAVAQEANGSAVPQAQLQEPLQGRIPGKLYYLVLLDTAASIEQPALADYDYFLRNLVVE